MVLAVRERQFQIVHVVFMLYWVEIFAHFFVESGQIVQEAVIVALHAHNLSEKERRKFNVNYQTLQNSFQFIQFAVLSWIKYLKNLFEFIIIYYLIDDFAAEFADEFEQLKMIIYKVGRRRRIELLICGHLKQIELRVKQLLDNFLKEFFEHSILIYAGLIQSLLKLEIRNFNSTVWNEWEIVVN